MYGMKHDKKSGHSAESHGHGVPKSYTGSMEHKEHHPCKGDECVTHHYGAGSAGKLNIYLKNKG